MTQKVTYREGVHEETTRFICFIQMRYAVREQLAGIGLMTLNMDDHKGTCGSGAYPILKSLTNHCY